MAAANTIRQEGEGWQYVMEAGENPQHVLVTVSGAFSVEALQNYVGDIQTIMGELMGPGRRFCPVIADFREANLGKMTLPAVLNAERSISRQYGTVVLVRHEGGSDQPVLDMFIQFLKMYEKINHSAIAVTHSLDEALAAISR